MAVQAAAAATAMAEEAAVLPEAPRLPAGTRWPLDAGEPQMELPAAAAAAGLPAAVDEGPAAVELSAGLTVT